MNPDPLERLPDALHRSVPASVRTAQREELLAAMAASKGTARAKGLLPGSSWAFGRVRTAGLAGALLLIPSTAAAQSSAPGDLLYPLKQASEQVQVVFDEDAPARNRIDEVVTLLNRDADTEDLTEAVRNAVDAVENSGNPELEEHLAEVRAEVMERRPDAVPDHAGAPGRPADPDRPGRPEDPGSPGRENRPDDLPPSGDPESGGDAVERDTNGQSDDADTDDDADDDGGHGRPEDAGRPTDRPDAPPNADTDGDDED